jgi:hypothetical protein
VGRIAFACIVSAAGGGGVKVRGPRFGEGGGQIGVVEHGRQRAL